MNRTTYLALAFVVVVSGYAMFSGDDESVTLESAVIAEAPVVDNPKSNESPQSVNTKNEDPVVLPKEGEAEEIDRAYQYQMAIAEFEALAPVEKLQQRKASLGKLITGEKISVNDEVAFQQDWERAGRAEPGYQHKKESTIINVNGTEVDYAQPGIVVADQVMIYVPENKRGILSELSTVAGIDAIEPVFKGAKPTNVPGQRDITGWQKINLKAPADKIKGIARALESFQEVDEAEPVYERKLSITPPTVQDLDDPLMLDQWHLDAANVKAAWDYLEANDLPAGGDDSIVVAVIDSGVDYNHPDLTANMWVNTQEIPANGIDDDENGFVDDIHGVSVLSENYSHSGDPNDDNGHGTHVAGIIASTGGNDVGGVGVAFNSKIMAVKAAQYSGVLTTTDIAEAIYYAVDNGADVINMSFGGYGRSQLEEDALVLAYSQAVLVAAAGNDGRPNEARCLGAPMYPANHAWVLGVMSRNQYPNANGDYMSAFSNYDCKRYNGNEYELMAPGSQVWSTLPGDSYSAWSGTSMAAPVVAGIAALARTKWPDKTVYSSRFIMGQVGATGGLTQAYTLLGKPPVSYPQVDANLTLTSTPAPELSFEELWLFDEVEQGENNDGDGRVDSGETVELAIVIRNRWGKADNVVATLSTPSGAGSADPYVTFTTDSVNYGAVGSFNKDDNGIEYDDGLLVTGVRNPFVFTVDENTPNNHIIPFTLTMTAENGLDPSDSSTYTFTSNFTLTVQRGRELPSIIDSDSAGTDGGLIDTDGVEDGIITLDSSALWIVDKPVLISKGTAVKVTEGSQIQFWSSLPDEAYTVWRTAYIQVEGSLDIEGTVLNPVTMFPSALFPQRTVILHPIGQGTVQMSYSKITNMYVPNLYSGNGVGFTKMDYNLFDRYSPERPLLGRQNTTSADSLCCESHPQIPWVQGAKGNRFYKLGSTQYLWEDSKSYAYPLPSGQDMALVDGATRASGEAKNTVFLKNIQTKEQYDGKVYLGSTFSNLSPSSDYALVEPFEYAGKTYAIFYSTNQNQGSSESVISDARSVARELGGTLLTVSSKDEIIAVNNWSYDLQTKPSSYWEDKYTLCEPVYETETFCKNEFASSNYYSGLLRQDDGTYEWDGDDSGYGDTFLASQYNWDQDQWQIDGGRTPQAYEIDYELKSNIIVMNAPVSMDADINVRNYPFSYIISDNNGYEWASAQKFILELPGALTQEDLDEGIANFKTNKSNTSFYNNAILNTWYDLDPMHWATIEGPNGDTSRRWDYTMDISGNFWGGAGDALVDIAITDFSDDFNKARVKYKPTLTTGAETAYPFVVKAEVLDSEGNRPDADRFGAQASKWRVTFNRDMDTTAQPLVTFGPAEPFTDFSIPGDWVDARTWEGTFTFTPITGDGWQNIRVAGAVAASNPWLVTGDDSERFRFELITSGTEALTLQALGLTDQVSLEWMQDDFELLHGYNLYRSMSEDGSYTRINSSTINKTIMDYVDTDVTPGVPHYYYFTVVSDGGESDPSNIAIATPVDTIDPVITHKTETVVSLDDSLTLRATVTDNIAVSSVNIIFRNAASSSWQTRAMLLTDSDENRYSLTLSGDDIGNQYLEYYIEAKDAVNTVTNGSAESPYKVFVSLPSDTDTDGDGVSNADDAFPYDPTETTDLDGDGVGDNADLDDDGDGYNDDVDAFPRDASEWVDTDGDGIGNNSDNDDDNDGVDDGSDRFPLDARGSKDSDNDGMPDQWETDNGLDPNDASDADSDNDFDGYTALQEFEADTSPLVSDRITQIVYHESSPFVAGFANNVRVMYRPSDASSGLNGLGLRVHYNSQYIESLVIDDLLLVDLVAVDAVSMPDSADFDDDPLTDSYMNIAWATTSGGSSWPGGSPVKLFDMKVSFSESVNANTKIHIRFTSSSTHPGYGFSSVPIKTTVNVNSLDIDGNGKPDALSDGLLILRSLFGLTDDALVQNAVATDANFSNAADIQSRINNLGEFLDIDGNGAVDPLSDGLLILRYLFGIRGATLINGVVAQDATRNTAAEIEAYLAKMVPVL